MNHTTHALASIGGTSATISIMLFTIAVTGPT
jgi:hypothetical protein